MSPITSNNGFIFPLYLYPFAASGSLFDIQNVENLQGRRPNFESKFLQQFAKALKLKFIDDGQGDLKKNFGPEDVFYYIYTILHSPVYRSRYEDFLKRDFPHIPLPSSKEIFCQLVPLGHQLAKLHLMEIHGPDLASYPIEGSNEVESLHYEEPSEQHPGRVYINKEQYFEGVPPEVWTFQVGGYQVCNKWLKARKGRILTYDEMNHYQRVVSALSETIRLMAEVDTVIDGHGGWPIQREKNKHDY